MRIASGVTGLLIKVTVKEDGAAVNLSSASVKKLKFRSPGGTVFEKDAGFFTNGSDGILTYTTEGLFLASGQKDEAWDIQAYVELSGGFQGHTFTDHFVVKPNIS